MSEAKPKDKGHTVNDLVITCSDFRYQEAIGGRLLKTHQVDILQSDRLAYPGSSKAVADGTLIPAIKKLHELHSFQTVWLIDHTDCGGFGGLEAFGGSEPKEIEAHFDSFERAKSALAAVLPQLEVKAFVVNLEGQAISQHP